MAPREKKLKHLHNFVLFKSQSGSTIISVYYQNETFWLSQKLLAALFDVDVRTISEHLKNIYNSGELERGATIRKFRIVQQEGSREVLRTIEHYNLDAIISVGYRVNSTKATQFRIWATNTLRDYMIKGFVVDDDRLKQGAYFGKDYFEELLEKIREIRASEHRFYRKITDIYALSADYDKDAKVTKDFFATVQNKLHWAITGKTAAEIIYSKVDATKPNLGLTTWKNAPKGKILRSDALIAKNFMSSQHLKELEQVVSSFLD